MQKQMIKLNTARNCLRYIVRAYGIKSIYIPYYICPTIKTALRKEGVSIRFYHINKDFFPLTDFEKDDFILYPNYFGICSENVEKLEKKYKNLIVDSAHSFYSKQSGLASFNSLRKFFQPCYGIKEGAYLYTEKVLNEEFATSDDYEINDYDFETLVKNENKLDDEDIKFISNSTKKIIDNIDFEEEQQRRLSNFYKYETLYSKQNEINFNLKKEDIPFVYPLLTKNEKLGYELEKQGLMIFRYWNGIPKNFEEYYFYKYLIPLPLY